MELSCGSLNTRRAEMVEFVISILTRDSRAFNSGRVCRI